MENLIYAVPGAGVLALLYAYIKASWVKKQDAGTEEMQEIAAAIQEGAMAFIAREYKVLSGFVVVVAAILAVANMGGEVRNGATATPIIAFSFVCGAVASALAGYFGMRVATNANVRTTAAARIGITPALNVAFSGGAVMGMSVVGLAVIGLGGLYILYTQVLGFNLATTINALAGFSMGASSIALFARVGGGIYTKAADVGADLVGKVEAGIPEDHPLNPATIADNVGDNVGDVAGMGADLYESYYGSILATIALGAAAAFTIAGVSNEVSTALAFKLAAAPMALAGLGIFCSIIGIFTVKAKENATFAQLLKGLHKGVYVASALIILGGFGILAFYITVVNLGAGRSVIINLTYPMFGSLFAAFWLKEHLPARSWAWMLAGFSGLLIFLGIDFQEGINFYDLLGIAGAIAAGIVVVLIRQLRHSEHTATIYSSQCFASAMFAAWPAVGPTLSLPGNAMLLMALAATIVAIGQLAMTHAYRTLSVARGSSIQMLLPITTAIGGFIFFNERFSGIELLGAALTLLATWQIIRSPAPTVGPARSCS